MSKSEDSHSIEHEPHLRGESESSRSAGYYEKLHFREVLAGLNNDNRPEDSVFDEPDILPGRKNELIDRDWSCDHCGYNLRGLTVETPCPECGMRTLYRPPPEGEESYGTWLSRHQTRVNGSTGWWLAVLLAGSGGIFAVIAALFGTSPGGALYLGLPLLMVVFGPVVEETMKIAAASYVIETRPYLFTQPSQIRLTGAGSALVFAAIENVLYLRFFNTVHTQELILWRWTVCVTLHVSCSLVAAQGLICVWTATINEKRRPNLSNAIPLLSTAILIHAVYNAAVVGWSSIP